MKILGISASQRKWGNTDILVHHALKGASEVGADARFLRLPDLDIHQCRNCLSCLFKDQDCMIQDQFPDLLKALREADGVVLGSPVHVLFAAGSIQNMLPRLFRQIYTGELAGKPGLAIAVGGRPGWEGWALYQVMVFFLSLGMPLIDRFTGHGQGPGEIFNDPDACSRALEAGMALGRGEETFRGEPGTCPVCHGDLVRTQDNGQPRCMLCDITGEWVEREGFKRLEPRPGSHSRWEVQENRDHFETLILPSGQRFQATKRELFKKLSEFRKGYDHG